LTSSQIPAHRPFRRTGMLLGALAAIAAVAIPATAADAAPKQAKKGQVTVMTRNLFLGADLGPGLAATNFQELANGAGVILNQVDANRFRLRAKGLAAEILRKKPDLVGLQEVSHWRTDECGVPLPVDAPETRYDYLRLLLEQLNKGEKRYEVVVSQPEFDFEVPVNVDGDEGTGVPVPALGIQGCELNGRLTMRDVILAKREGVKTTAATGGHFENLLAVEPGSFPVDVTRGWTRANVKIEGVPKFRFVNTHLEAFDDETVVPSIRSQQAGELIAPGGPATGRLPVVLVGDLNSDVRTEVQDGDAQAFQALLDAGFRPRSTWEPLSCCLSADVLSEDGGGEVTQFDHKVDHVMTDTPDRVRLTRSSVTGRQPVNGFWSSDHAGVVSTLKVGR
jgi:endonuclease/exonuclease/phosphatase family metal-dependent hydrolase